MRRILGWLCGAVALVLVGSMLPAFAATVNATQCRAAAGNLADGVNSAEVLKYDECRFDRLDAAVAKLQPTAPPPSPSATPTASATPKPTATASPTPTATATTTAPAGAVCTAPAFTFTGEGSRGMAGGYDASAEQWGVSGYNYRSTMGVCTKDSWFVDVTTDNAKGDGAVKAYPSMRRIFHDWSTTDFSKDPRLSSFPQLKAEFASTDPASCAGCIYDTAFDIWLNGIGGSNNTELMVWTHNVGQRPYGEKVASGVQLDGHTWDLWSGNANHYIAYVPTDTDYLRSGTLDVKAFVADLQARGRIADSALGQAGKDDPYVGQISFGVEPVSTGGVSRHWDFTRFNVVER